MQDATKVLLGAAKSARRNVTNFASDPATYLAGLVVSRASVVDTISLLKSAGGRIGVSMGRSLSDTKRTAVLRSGLDVPVRAHLKRASGTVTITSYANLVATTPDTLAVAGTSFAFQSGAATPGAATVQAATSNNATATSLATQINAHATVSLKVYAVAASAVVTLYAVDEGVGSTGTGNDVPVVYTDNHSDIGLTLGGLTGGKLAGGLDTVAGIDYGTIGAKMYINDVTGKADVAMSGFSTVTAAIYKAAPLNGIDEDGNSVPALVVDMRGGL